MARPCVAPFAWFGLKGMGVCPAGLVLPNGKPKENTGHHHLLVNAKEMPPMNLPLAASETLIHFGGGQTETTLDLPPGEHTLQLVFADFAHIPHDPPVISKKITIKVEAPKKKELDTPRAKHLSTAGLGPPFLFLQLI